MIVKTSHTIDVCGDDTQEVIHVCEDNVRLVYFKRHGKLQGRSTYVVTDKNNENPKRRSDILTPSQEVWERLSKAKVGETL